MIFSNYSKTELKGIAEKRLNKINQKLENAENPNSESLDDLSLSEFEQYCSEHKDLLDKEDHYIGTWHDPNTGTKYLDISINTQDAKVAREQCKQKDQIAYFDLQDFSSVEVDANATSGQH